jgi:3-phenylpropionate/trans-cinnamate dioxygenase ferredoxin component
VARVDEIPAGTMKSVIIQDISILVANVDGRFYAMDNACTHAGVGLSNGTLTGTIITCPRAGSQFDVTSGARVRGPAMRRVRIHNVKIEAGDVKVEI